MRGFVTIESHQDEDPVYDLIASDLITATYEDGEWLSRVQQAQDTGQTWGDAVKLFGDGSSEA